MKHKTPLKYHAKKKHFWFDLSLVVVLWCLVYFVPYSQTVFKVIAAVATLELIAFFSFHLLNQNSGIIIQGFLGGLVSSTATFIKFSSPKKSKVYNHIQSSLGLLSATAAMLFGCCFISINFLRTSQYKLMTPFLLQLLVIFIYGSILFKRTEKLPSKIVDTKFDIEDPVIWKNVFKLSLFIIALIYSIRFLNHSLGLGTNIALFIMSFFEAHGVLTASLLSEQKSEPILLQMLLILTGETMSKWILLYRAKNIPVFKHVGITLLICLSVSWLSYFFLK
ncbi:MAG: DUF4010 domain-containing protein [Bacteriovoracaceae bacterium]